MATVAEHTEIPTPRIAPHPTTLLVGRLLLAAIFFVSGFAKLTNTDATAGHMAEQGIPEPYALAIVAGIAEIAGALSLTFGFLTRIGAIGLVLFMIPTTLLFHDFWAVPAAEQKMQMINFLKNLAIIGGLAIIAANGAGRYSFDAKLRSRLR
jgi:putative oxidoreductase